MCKGSSLRGAFGCVIGDGLEGGVVGLLDHLRDDTSVVFRVFLQSRDQGKVISVAAFGKAVIAQGQQADKFICAIAKCCDGGDGGRPDLA